MTAVFCNRVVDAVPDDYREPSPAEVFAAFEAAPIDDEPLDSDDEVAFAEARADDVEVVPVHMVEAELGHK